MIRRGQREAKRCARCHETKPIAEFGTVNRRANGGEFLRAYCRPCHNERRRKPNPMPLSERGKFVRAKKACAKCGVVKAVMAFTAGGPNCRKCEPTGHERMTNPTAYQHMQMRVTFEAWTELHNVTANEHSVIRTALARYGRSGQPCADRIIEEHCGAEVYDKDKPPRRASVLRHAVVLLANELARSDDTRARRGPSKRRPPTYRTAELGRTDDREAA